MAVLINFGRCRGPHHPRGATIVKHHVHYKPTKKITQETELLHDKQHIQEHLEEIIEDIPDLSQMSDNELEFYYFQLHDTDKNSKLDGLEMIKAIYHTKHNDDDDDDDDDDDGNDDDPPDKSKKEFDTYIELINKVLQEDDADGDGYISYSEYSAGILNNSVIQNVEIV